MSSIAPPAAPAPEAEAVRAEIDNLVSYAIHLTGDPEGASEFVVAGLHHALAYPPATWTSETRSCLYRAVTKACRQQATYPRRPKGLARLFRRSEEPFFVDVDTTLVSKVNTVKRALNSMPFEKRACLLLKDFVGLSYRDIARSLECSPQAACRLVALSRREFGTVFREIAI